MLTELCGEIRNWFVRDIKKDIHDGTFMISDGVFTSPFLIAGQYYRICGSLFNDGVHKYGDPSDHLIDETFDGTIWAMAVPSEVVALSDEIDAWKAKYADASNSPYQSESFGGYTYSLGRSSWRGVFADRMNRWRKIC